MTYLDFAEWCLGWVCLVMVIVYALNWNEDRLKKRQGPDA